MRLETRQPKPDTVLRAGIFLNEAVRARSELRIVGDVKASASGRIYVAAAAIVFGLSISLILGLLVPFPTYARLAGTLERQPTGQILLSPINGVVSAVYVEPASIVHQGQPVLQVRSTSMAADPQHTAEQLGRLQTQHAALLAELAAHERMIQIAEKQRTLENTKNLEQRAGFLRRSENAAALWHLWEGEELRLSSAQKQGFATQAAYANARAQMLAARQSHDDVTVADTAWNSEHQKAMLDLSAAESEQQAQEQSLSRALSINEADQDDVLRRNTVTVVASLEGEITSALPDLWSPVTANTPLAQVQPQDAHLMVVMNVPRSNGSGVRAGETAKMWVSRAGGLAPLAVDGTVASTESVPAPGRDASGQAYRITVRLEGVPPGKLAQLRAGQGVEARIRVGRQPLYRRLLPAELID